MARGPRSVYRLAQPIRSLAHRFAYISMVAAAIGLMILGKVDVLLMDSIRAHVTDTVAPILDALSRPAESVAKAIEHVRQLSALRQENTLLRESQARLLQWQTAALRLEAENKNLRDLLNYGFKVQQTQLPLEITETYNGKEITLVRGHCDGLLTGMDGLREEDCTKIVFEVKSLVQSIWARINRPADWYDLGSFWRRYPRPRPQGAGRPNSTAA